jgi:hypothetical protein
LSTGTNRYILRTGFGDTSGADQVNGVYFEYSDNINTGQWVIKTASASSRTTTNSTIAVTAGWHDLRVVVNAAGTSITFTVDGVTAGTIVTNIPTAATTAFLALLYGAGTIAANTIQVDLFQYNQILTLSR